MNINSLELVQNLLTSKYGEPFPSSIKKEDFLAGLELFTKLAVQSAEKPTALSQRNVSLQSESPSETAAKIEVFVERYSYSFWSACSTGLPFSMFDPATSTKVLQITFQNCSSIIVNLLYLEDPTWLSEEELNSRFGEAFKHLNAREVGVACAELKTLYTFNGDNKAAFYMLWLIKHTARCNFEIPPQRFFYKSTTKNVLTEFTLAVATRYILNETLTINHTANFLTILYSKASRLDRPLFHEFIHIDYHSLFLDYTVDQLNSIPTAAWPNKGRFVTSLLEIADTKSKIDIASALKTSYLPKTAEIGSLFLNAFNATSMRAAIPHFYALIELLPHLNQTHFEIFFGRPFVTFREDKSIFKSDPEFTRRLIFNDMRNVFVSGDLMIGVYNSRSTHGGRGVPPHLLAYNMKTEKMEWGVPLAPNSMDLRYELNRVGEDITLQYIDQKNVYFIDSKSGEVKSPIILPYEKLDEYDCFHLTPDGFGYQMLRLNGSRRLIGGPISDLKLNILFDVETPVGAFLPLSTHVGFFYDVHKKLVLFGPTGKSVTIDCISAKAFGDKLYLIEPNPSVKDTCKLTIRTMTTDDSVITAPEKTIILKTKVATIANLCESGQLILFGGSGFNISPIFVNLDSEEIVYGKHKMCSLAEQVINTATGDVWSWDENDKKIWKTSSNETLLMGPLESGRGTTLLHVDESDHLYFVDIPF